MSSQNIENTAPDIISARLTNMRIDSLGDSGMFATRFDRCNARQMPDDTEKISEKRKSRVESDRICMRRMI